MCGFTGFLNWRGGQAEALDVATRMAQALSHRGPDDAGAWADAQAGVGLGHRRLAVVDLSAAGHQPMASASGRLVLAFNGEIYNHLELRAQLEAAGVAPPWRGHSDTETLLAAFEHLGVPETLRRTVGMFAIALWDRRERVLYLARDRFGEKPLYYGWSGGAFVFGSELKALRAWPGFDNPVCRQALVQYLRFMYVPAPRSIYQRLFKLESGCVLAIRAGAAAGAPAQPPRPGQCPPGLEMGRWWSLAQAVEAGAREPVADEAEAVELLQQRLQEAVRLQSLADVPLGAFLSGGVDSSTIVALMQRQCARPVRTFTVGFEEGGFDESAHALAVARHLGTDHTQVMLSAAQAREVIPSLPHLYDEPFADSSQIPTALVCRVARRHVTVALSGDAGDELFGGYNRYFWGPRIWQRLAWMPFSLRRAIGQAIVYLPMRGWDALAGAAPGAPPLLGDKVHRLAARLRQVRNTRELYLSLMSEWNPPAALVRGGGGAAPAEPLSLLDDPLPGGGLEDDPLPMMYADSITYLPDDILCKVDRAAMGASLETRVPFLDHRVAELAWALPLHLKIRAGQGKWALRQVLYRHVPRELVERPKAGFGLPLGAWLKGPLRDWAEALLDERRLRGQGWLEPAPIRALWAEHLAGRRDGTARLWSVLMFQAWLDAAGQGARAARAALAGVA
jgi:asparagine synthase (glutamine-hydrolysing)